MKESSQQHYFLGEVDFIADQGICIVDLGTADRYGTVIGVGKDKLYILLDDISIEIKLYIRPLELLWKTSLSIDQNQLSLVNSES